MDYYGLFPKFKFNRPLKNDELTYQLKQYEAAELHGQPLIPDGKVITVNSCYIEMVDKYYSGKGFLGLVASAGFFGMTIMYLLMFIHSLPLIGWRFSTSVKLLLSMSLILIPGIIATFILLKKEWFAWTHYPMRFDRKNRLVHVFRIDGTTFSVAWDKVFFTTGLSHRKDFNKDYYISGHVLAEDNKTVIDSFCLPATHSDREQLKRHWEFVRRYMEEGPQSVIDEIDFCLPIAKKREGYSLGLLYLLLGFNGMPVFLFPFCLILMIPFSIPRYIAMATSRIPVWPESIESQCPVDKDDPYKVDASSNAKHLWRDMFKKTSPGDKGSV